MQVYLVGGAVRDELLGRPVPERDWVVVGATPAQLESQGYRSVGREFPVFLHPRTHEEYALARLERKTAPGYHGFSVQFSPDVTLEQDLQRRDLTINAMALDENGHLIDPYGGARDLKLRLLRHVSPAFVEDPVRVLRVARFAARFASLGFRVAPETEALMRQMVRNGEVDALVPERVWRELERALGESNPEVWFDVLKKCGALKSVLPELAWSDRQRLALLRAVQLTPDRGVRFAAALANLAPETIAALCERLRVPAEHRELALLGARFAPRLGTTAARDAAQLLEMFEQCDAFRRPERFDRLLLAAQSLGSVDGSLKSALTATAAVRLPREQLAALKGAAIAAALRAARLQRLQTLYQ
jgi:tRNA nucleotidyltransferase (CCA-adding enzyme)